jgi:hypothetical protein
MASPDPRPRTADSLRADIDRGLTGDKIPGSDPAAAPLGTDAEAAGAPPTRREVDLEARSRTVRPHGEGLEGAKTRGRGINWVVAACLVVAVVALVVGLGIVDIGTGRP